MNLHDLPPLIPHDIELAFIYIWDVLGNYSNYTYDPTTGVTYSGEHEVGTGLAEVMTGHGENLARRGHTLPAPVPIRQR